MVSRYDTARIDYATAVIDSFARHYAGRIRIAPGVYITQHYLLRYRTEGSCRGSIKTQIGSIGVEGFAENHQIVHAGLKVSTCKRRMLVVVGAI